MKFSIAEADNPAEKEPSIQCPVCSREMQSGTAGMWLHYIEFKCDYIAAINELIQADKVIDSIIRPLARPEAWKVTRSEYKHQMVDRAQHFEPRESTPFHEVKSDIVNRYTGTLDWVDPPRDPWEMVRRALEIRDSTRRNGRMPGTPEYPGD